MPIGVSVGRRTASRNDIVSLRGTSAAQWGVEKSAACRFPDVEDRWREDGRCCSDEGDPRRRRRESLAVRHVGAVVVAEANGDEPRAPDHERALRDFRKTGKVKKVCLTDSDASMATSGRNRRLEPSDEQHGVVDNRHGVVLDVEVTTGEVNEGERMPTRLDAAAAATGAPIATVTADAGCAHGKIFGGLEEREIAAVIPTGAEPIRSPVPLRRVRYDLRHDILKCPEAGSCSPASR